MPYYNNAPISACVFIILFDIHVSNLKKFIVNIYHWCLQVINMDFKIKMEAPYFFIGLCLLIALTGKYINSCILCFLSLVFYDFFFFLIVI